MRGYLRPRIPEGISTDADGARIHYGSRWPESPPEDSYSVTSNLERFEGIHTTARELIRHLSGRFETDMETDGGSVDGARLEHAARALQALPDGWEAWTLLPGLRT